MQHLKPKLLWTRRSPLSNGRSSSEKILKTGCCCSRLLWGCCTAAHIAFSGDATRDLAEQFMVTAQKHKAPVPIMIGHRLKCSALLLTGNIAERRDHCQKRFSLYNPTLHRALASRFGQDTGVTVLTWRGLADWLLGYPDRALADADQVVKDAHAIGVAGTLMFALINTAYTQIFLGNYSKATVQSDEALALAQENGTLLREAYAKVQRGCILTLTGNAPYAVDMITSGLTSYRSTGSTWFMPVHLSFLARAYATVDQSDEASRWISEAINTAETAKERWYEAEMHRNAGEISLLSSRRDAVMAEGSTRRLPRGYSRMTWRD